MVVSGLRRCQAMGMASLAATHELSTFSVRRKIESRRDGGVKPRVSPRTRGMIGGICEPSKRVT